MIILRKTLNIQERKEKIKIDKVFLEMVDNWYHSKIEVKSVNFYFRFDEWILLFMNFISWINIQIYVWSIWFIRVIYF